jgi:hypothetical protein
MNEANDKNTKTGGSGKWLVIAIFAFALPVGSSGLALRAYVRGVRGHRTFDGLVAKLKKDGYFKNSPPESPPRFSELDRLSRAFDTRSIPQMTHFTALTLRMKQFQSASLKHRREAYRSINRLFDGLQKRPKTLKRLSSNAAHRHLTGILDSPSLTLAFENEFFKQVAWLDRREKDIRDKHNFFVELFPLAEAGDVRACYARILGSSMEASKVDHGNAMLVIKRAKKIADQQISRISDQSLLVFPQIVDLMNTEYKVRTRLTLLATAMELLNGHKTAPAQLDSEAKDPVTDNPIQYQRLSSNKARLSTATGEVFVVSF